MPESVTVATPASPSDPEAFWVRDFPGTADQVGHARAAVRAHLGPCPVADGVIQLISELAANAVVHSDSGRPGGRFTVRVFHVLGDYVAAEVEDQGSGWDGSIWQDAASPHGLCLLQEMAAVCSADRIGMRTWLISFRIDYPPAQRARPHPAA